MFLEDSLDQASLLTILEEDPISKNNSINNNQPITIQFSNTLNITEPISL